MSYTDKLAEMGVTVPGVNADIRKGVSVFLFGPPGTYKTTWAATWPSPLFISTVKEGGWRALDHVPRLFGLNHGIPRIYIESVAQMTQAVDALLAPAQTENGVVKRYQERGVKTLVIDMVTSYVDMWISELMAKKARAGIHARGEDVTTGVQMEQQDWGKLERHLFRELAYNLNGLPDLNVIWIAWDKEVWSGSGEDRILKGYEPMISGNSKLKLPGCCDMIIFANTKLVPAPGDPNNPDRVQKVVQYHTGATRKNSRLRHRFTEQAFPHGMLCDPRPEVGTSWPTFQAIDAAIGEYIAK